MTLEIIDHFVIRSLQCMNKNYTTDTKNTVSQIKSLIEIKLNNLSSDIDNIDFTSELLKTKKWDNFTDVSLNNFST